MPVIDAASVNLVLDPEGPWREAPQAALRDVGPAAGRAPDLAASSRPTHQEPPQRTGARSGTGTSVAQRASSPASASPASASPPTATRLPVPAARGLGSTAPKGTKPTKPLDQLARERYLDFPTEIEAEQITLYAPPAILAEGLLTGASLSEPSPGRRVALGNARLALRELTLRAPRIILRARTGALDIQITARGAVQFVSHQHEQVVREQDLKSLIVTNDRLMPLR